MTHRGRVGELLPKGTRLRIETRSLQLDAESAADHPEVERGPSDGILTVERFGIVSTL